MTLRSPTLPARYVRLMVACLERRLAQVPSAVDIDLAAFARADAPVALADVDALLGAVEAHVGDWPIGFEVGLMISFQSHDALGLAMSRCQTCDQLTRLTCRYYDLVTPSFAMTYDRVGEVGRISYRPLAAMSPRVLRTINEVHAVAFHTTVSMLLGPRLEPYDIAFHMEAPKHAARYEGLAPARVHFAALPLPEVLIEAPLRLLDAPLAGGDPADLARARSGLLLDRSSCGEASRWSDWVRLILTEAEEAQPSMDQLAALLNVTARTLARQLEREGFSFRDLAKEIRQERACRWLAAGDTSISEIAYRLGYTDVANFSHAFRRMSGRSPRAWARAARDLQLDRHPSV